MKCTSCEKPINFRQPDGYFIVEYLPEHSPNVSTHHNNSTSYEPLFFCPACFIGAAGKDWAAKTGYKIKKAPSPNKKQ